MTKEHGKPPSALRAFLQNEAAGGYVLMAAALVAVLIANSPLAAPYHAMLASKLGPLSLHHWINDGLMALFFLHVGLEIKRELRAGHLAHPADRRLPVLAAAAGMAVPAIIYLALARGDPALARGWAIPAATDIAFAIGVLVLLGRRVPASLKLLLTTIAIVDDMGAVAIIALGYTDHLSALWLGVSAAFVAGLWGVNRIGVRAPWVYLAGFILLWIAVLQSGVHATLAGVLTAMMVPVAPEKGSPNAAQSTLHRLEQGLHLPVAFWVVPLFGFANAGVTLSGQNIGDALPVAIAAGLFLGKQIGIFGAIWLAVRLGFAAKPAGANWGQVYGMALLCGIGFTMSLFIGDLAFRDAMHANAVRMGVLMGSLASAVAGALVLYLARTKKEAA
ncbi:MAG: Na+/H+ antiporter NhaA [Chakrabartia sp.]